MKVSLMYFKADGGVKEVAGDTITLVTEILEECKKFDYKVDLNSILGKYQDSIDTAIVDLDTSLVEGIDKSRDKVNYSRKNELEQSVLGQISVDLIELVGNIDMREVLRDIGNLTVTTVSNMEHNLKIVELMVMVNQGDDFAKRKLTELTKLNLIDEKDE